MKLFSFLLIVIMSSTYGGRASNEFEIKINNEDSIAILKFFKDNPKVYPWIQKYSLSQDTYKSAFLSNFELSARHDFVKDSIIICKYVGQDSYHQFYLLVFKDKYNTTLIPIDKNVDAKYTESQINKILEPYKATIGAWPNTPRIDSIIDLVFYTLAFNKINDGLDAVSLLSRNNYRPHLFFSGDTTKYLKVIEYLSGIKDSIESQNLRAFYKIYYKGLQYHIVKVEGSKVEYSIINPISHMEL